MSKLYLHTLRILFAMFCLGILSGISVAEDDRLSQSIEKLNRRQIMELGAGYAVTLQLREIERTSSLENIDLKNAVETGLDKSSEDVNPELKLKMKISAGTGSSTKVSEENTKETIAESKPDSAYNMVLQKADINKDGIIDDEDVYAVAEFAKADSPKYSDNRNLDGKGGIDDNDLSLVLANMGKIVIHPKTPEAIMPSKRVHKRTSPSLQRDFLMLENIAEIKVSGSGYANYSVEKPADKNHFQFFTENDTSFLVTYDRGSSHIYQNNSDLEAGTKNLSFKKHAPTVSSEKHIENSDKTKNIKSPDGINTELSAPEPLISDLTKSGEENITKFREAILMVKTAYMVQNILSETDISTVKYALDQLTLDHKNLYGDFLSKTADIYNELSHVLFNDNDADVIKKNENAVSAENVLKQKLIVDMKIQSLLIMNRKELSSNEKKALSLYEKKLRPLELEYHAFITQLLDKFLRTVKETVFAKSGANVTEKNGRINALFISENRGLSLQ